MYGLWNKDTGRPKCGIVRPGILGQDMVGFQEDFYGKDGGVGKAAVLVLEFEMESAGRWVREWSRLWRRSIGLAW